VSAPPPPPASAADGDLVYAYKPSLLGAPWEFRLTPDALEWQAGRRRGRVPYGRISRIRLSFRPVTMQTRRFVTEIWWPGGPRLTIASSSWRSPLEQVAQDRDYGAFVRALNARLAVAGAAVSFETGAPAVLYWPGLAVFIAVTVTLTVLAVRALAAGATAGAALVAAFFALFIWQSGAYFRRNRPRRYRPEAPPRELVPDG
jgi:hypothetical protein